LVFTSLVVFGDDVAQKIGGGLFFDLGH
jgi:hypothetical protein